MISVTKTADPTVGSPGMTVTFTMVVKNIGESALTHTFVSDLLPDGMSLCLIYTRRHEIAARLSSTGPTWVLLPSMVTKTLSIKAKIVSSVSGKLTNNVSVTSKPEHGENVTSSATADVVSQLSGITVEKTATPE